MPQTTIKVDTAAYTDFRIAVMRRERTTYGKLGPHLEQALREYAARLGAQA